MDFTLVLEALSLRQPLTRVPIPQALFFPLFSLFLPMAQKNVWEEGKGSYWMKSKEPEGRRWVSEEKGTGWREAETILTRWLGRGWGPAREHGGSGGILPKYCPSHPWACLFSFQGPTMPRNASFSLPHTVEMFTRTSKRFMKTLWALHEYTP